MATNRLEVSNGETETAAAPRGASNSSGAGGLKTWLPLISNLILMPVLAYGMTVFVLLPKLGSSGGQTSTAHTEGVGNHADRGSKEPVGKTKFMVNLSGKILVNVSGTGGTRYLLATLTLVGPNSE